MLLKTAKDHPEQMTENLAKYLPLALRVGANEKLTLSQVPPNFAFQRSEESDSRLPSNAPQDISNLLMAHGVS